MINVCSQQTSGCGFSKIDSVAGFGTSCGGVIRRVMPWTRKQFSRRLKSTGDLGVGMVVENLEIVGFGRCLWKRDIGRIFAMPPPFDLLPHGVGQCKHCSWSIADCELRVASCGCAGVPTKKERVQKRTALVGSVTISLLQQSMLFLPSSTTDGSTSPIFHEDFMVFVEPKCIVDCGSFLGVLLTWLSSVNRDSSSASDSSSISKDWRLWVIEHNWTHLNHLIQMIDRFCETDLKFLIVDTQKHKNIIFNYWTCFGCCFFFVFFQQVWPPSEIHVHQSLIAQPRMKFVT